MSGKHLSLLVSRIAVFMLSLRASGSIESENDRVLSLPGLPALLSATYSGYLHISATKHIHYVYIESYSNPETDPVMFWTNGGPGCSGLLGLFSGTTYNDYRVLLSI